jgi:hypothetical protein
MLQNVENIIHSLLNADLSPHPGSTITFLLAVYSFLEEENERIYKLSNAQTHSCKN